MRHDREEQQDSNEGKEASGQENEGPEEDERRHEEEVHGQVGMEE